MKREEAAVEARLRFSFDEAEAYVQAGGVDGLDTRQREFARAQARMDQIVKSEMDEARTAMEQAGECMKAATDANRKADEETAQILAAHRILMAVEDRGLDLRSIPEADE
jgi:multidrug efflux pump subunit AcrA (membrane-fusion protein)